MSDIDLELFTARYSDFKPEWGVPVQSSNGRPKYPIQYDLKHLAASIVPPWKLVSSSMSDAEFDVAYAKELDRRGFHRVLHELRGIARAEGDNRLVIMCFEKNPRNCHRMSFGLWWTAKTGKSVRELPGAPIETVSKPEPLQGTFDLFPPVAQRIERGLS